MAETILRTEYSDVMQKSYIDYSMSVITARAVPDVRDGLKPVQRRVLYAMDQLGLNYDKPHRKSARIVGDAMGKYHPHGDSSIYETLVVLEQDFKKGMALVDGHGNFGSIEGDGAAAMRYTEARLKKFTQEVYLKDLDKDVVDFIPNFDETEMEPAVLPVRVPNLLINGAEGIAVGMTTSIPTHNLVEVINAVEAYMDNEKITTEELMEFMPGPDFPTGGIVINKSELKDIYESGSGKIKIRGKVEFEPGQKKSDKDKLVISEIPYTMIGAGISKFISDVVDLIENKLTQEITDISNESSKEGIRIVLELKKNADVKKLENLLYKKTRLEDTFGVNMLTIAEGRPEVLGLKDIIRHNINFQYEINERKYKTLLKKEYDNKEVKEGLIRACDIIDLIIEILRGSKNLKQAKACLIEGITEGINFKSKASEKEASGLHFTERQASAILELRLYRLIGLEIEALQKEYEDTLAKIAKYEEILGSRKAMKKAIKKDLDAIKKEYGVKRLTAIEDAEAAVYVKPEITEQEVVFLMDRFGYSKVIDTASFERNKETVFAENKYVFTCLNTEKICIFTDNGNLHQIKILDIPFTRVKDKGTPIDNLGNYSSAGEEIVFLCSSSQLKGRKLLFVTQNAMMKLVDGMEFDASKRTIASTKLAIGDKVIMISFVDVQAAFSLDNSDGMGYTSTQTVVLQSKNGMFLKFMLEEIPEKKKGAVGVRGMKLTEEDVLDEVYLIPESADIIIDYRGKEVSLKKLKMAKRDGKGTKVRI